MTLLQLEAVVNNVHLIDIHYLDHMELYNANKKSRVQKSIILLVIVIVMHKPKKEFYNIIGSYQRFVMINIKIQLSFRKM